ncbi:hypothetical protein [Piscinibacter sp.]|uniref:hypothetical protein n=1 Tax=Piscinibacter sp. TaxID=1903157 RepID=UPI00258E7DEC|nr:hypothetical protein [Piscinibacter sp.]
MREPHATLDKHAARVLDHLNPRDRATVEKSLLPLLEALHEDVDLASCGSTPQGRTPTKERRSCC